MTWIKGKKKPYRRYRYFSMARWECDWMQDTKFPQPLKFTIANQNTSASWQPPAFLLLGVATISHWWLGATITIIHLTGPHCSRLLISPRKPTHQAYLSQLPFLWTSSHGFLPDAWKPPYTPETWASSCYLHLSQVYSDDHRAPRLRSTSSANSLQIIMLLDLTSLITTWHPPFPGLRVKHYWRKIRRWWRSVPLDSHDY